MVEIIAPDYAASKAGVAHLTTLLGYHEAEMQVHVTWPAPYELSSFGDAYGILGVG